MRSHWSLPSILQLCYTRLALNVQKCLLHICCCNYRVIVIVVVIMGCFKDCPLHPSWLLIILIIDGYSWCTSILSFLHVFLISLTLLLSHSWATWCTACSSLQQVVLVLLSYDQSGYFFSVLKTDYAKADFTVAHFSVTIDNSFSLSYTHYWNTFLVVISPLSSTLLYLAA